MGIFLTQMKMMIDEQILMAKNDRKFESVFCVGDDWQSNACINWANDPISLFAIGYKGAADNLVKYILLKARDQDTMVYPILFLYRQYIELRLKEIIREGNILLEKDETFPKHHNMVSLWKNVKEISKEVFKNEEELLDLSHAEHVIIEFAKIDPGSFSFRYPESKAGINPLEGMTHINIRGAAVHINKLSEDLENISLGMSVYREWQQDMWSSI